MINLNTNTYLKIALGISIIIAISGFFADFLHTQKFAGIDLRNRVIGARVLNELNEDPYFFKWSEGKSDRYLDPNDNVLAPFYTRLTITPAVLLFHSPISSLPYKTQQWLWFFLQWASLLGSIFLLAKILAKNKQSQILIWILGLFAISGSMFWRLHAERGQIYIIYVLLFCLSLYLYNKYKKGDFTSKINPLLAGSGLILGYLASLRPTYIFAIIPFLIYKKIKFASFVAVGLLASVIISTFIFRMPVWENYYNSMQQQAEMRLDDTQDSKTHDFSMAEGIDVRDFLSVVGEESSLQRMFRAAFDKWYPSEVFMLLLFIFLSALIIFLHKHKTQKITSQELFFIGIAIVLFSEFFIPAPRWPYANVIWLIPLAFIISRLKDIKTTPLVVGSYVIALIGLLSNLGFYLIPRFTFFGDVGIPFAILLFMIAMIKQKKEIT
jgi:hypothetical protein